MTRARDLSKLANETVWTIDTTNTRVGIGSTIPTSSLNVGLGITMDGPSGVITATSYVGDGSGLEGVASAGLGSAISDDSTSALNVLYYVNKSLDITTDTTVTVPATSTSDTAYTNYQEIIVADTKNLTIADGDSLMLDVLNLDEV
tara:strand:+ start:3044 stop:3481 length:438 start_codon:yes stop_codon:yes gene_type:complete